MTLPVELVARWKPGENLPVYADPSAITAGRFVRITGKNTQGAYKAVHAGAAGVASGVAERSCPAVSGRPTVHNSTNIARRGSVARVEAGAAVAVGAEVESDASGRGVTFSAGVKLGRALTAAAQAGDIIEVDLY